MMGFQKRHQRACFLPSTPLPSLSTEEKPCEDTEKMNVWDGGSGSSADTALARTFVLDSQPPEL